MKKRDKKSVCAYKDEAYHHKVKSDLEVARLACQQLLDEWNRLKIGTIMDMDALQIRPEQCYIEAIEKSIPFPVTGERFAVKKEAYLTNYLSTHDVPDPSELYRIAKQSKNVLYCSVPGLFLSDGKTVSLDEGIANFYMTMNDVVIPESEPDKIALSDDLKTFVELFNSLNVRLNQELFDSASPVSNNFFSGKFGFVGGDQRGNNGKLVLLPDALRKWLQ